MLFSTDTTLMCTLLSRNTQHIKMVEVFFRFTGHLTDTLSPSLKLSCIFTVSSPVCSSAC